VSLRFANPARPIGEKLTPTPHLSSDLSILAAGNFVHLPGKSPPGHE